MGSWNSDFIQYLGNSYRFYNEMKHIGSHSPKEYGEFMSRRNRKSKQKRRKRR